MVKDEPSLPLSIGKCPHCQVDVPIGAIKCQHCGEILANRLWQFCKSALAVKERTCPSCAKALTQSPSLLLQALILCAPVIFGWFAFRSFYPRGFRVAAAIWLGMGIALFISPIELSTHQSSFDSLEQPEESLEAICIFAGTFESKVALKS